MKPPKRIPRDVVTLVGSIIMPDYTLHCFAKNNRTVVVQTKYLDPTRLLPQGCEENYDQAYEKAKYETLEMIHSSLNSLRFSDQNWAYVNQTVEGFQPIQRRKSFKYLITCERWAPYISEDEVEITEWNCVGHASGFWREEPVVIYYGWDEDHTKQVNKAMIAARALRGLDVTQEVYGHLVNSEGEIIGLVVEATKGRAVRLEDRSIVYEAVAKLQRHFCLFPAFKAGFVLISEGKVRFADLSYITYYPPGQRQDFEEKADRLHWDYLEIFFSELEEGLTPMIHFHFFKAEPITLVYPEAPHRPLPLLATYLVLVPNDHGEEEYHCWETDNSDPFQLLSTVYYLGIQNGFKAKPFEERDRALPYTAPLVIQPRNKSRRSRNPSITLSHPYRRNASTRPPPSRHPVYADSDCTSESGQSSRFEEIF